MKIVSKSKLSPAALACGVLALMLAGGCQSSTSTSPGAGQPSGDKPNVVLLRYKAGSESTEQREQGFLDTLAKEYPGIHVLSSSEYAGTRPEEAVDKAQQVFTRHGDAIHGIFAVCEPNAMGVLEAMESAGLSGRVKFVAFDPADRLVAAMAQDKVHGIVLQDPYKMGYLAVKTLVAHLDGQEVEKTISTGEYVATPENMNGRDEQGADIAALLHPVQFKAGDEARPTEKKYTLAVIPKGTTHEFWKSVHAGAEAAARELGGVEIQWQGPLNENDTDGQVSVVQNFVAKKVDGIVLAPNDSQGLVQAVRGSQEAGIPVVIFDSGLNDAEAYVSYVATDNYRGGQLAARRLAAALGVAPASADSAETTSADESN